MKFMKTTQSVLNCPATARFPAFQGERARCSAVGCVGVLLAALAAPAGAGSVAYTYDTLGRLTAATYSDGVVLAYTYDAAGNRTARTVTGAPLAARLAASAAHHDDALAAHAIVDLAVLPLPLPLELAAQDPGVYGWNDLSDIPETTVAAVFTGDGADRLLHVQGYAITEPDQLGLWLNGTLLGYLSPAATGFLSTPSLWWLPAQLQQPGENRIEFRASTLDQPWGITRLGLYPFGSVWGNQAGLLNADLMPTEGLELHLLSEDPWAEAGLLVELVGWDIDSDDELSITLNAAPSIHLPSSEDEAWGRPYHLWLDPASLVVGDNRLLIDPLFGPFEPWGLRLERVILVKETD